MPEDFLSRPSETIKQSEPELSQSRELSSPADIRQAADAPKIPGYVLTSLIGSGAYAQVWKAWQARTRKFVAVKVFTQQSGVNWIFLQREVERLIRLDKHPHIVSLLDADLTGDPAYYVMDLMEGGSLARYVDSGKTATPEQAARWMEEIASALAYVHGKGLIHCDLKPANVLLDGEGRVRVADFGQSRILSESSGALGTLYYMAPEQALTFSQNELLHPDVRWDVYGLGTTMYAVLTGKAPYAAELGKEVESKEALADQLKAYRDGIRGAGVPVVGAKADAELSAMVAKCMAPWVEERYGGAAEVSGDLKARREGLPVSPLAGSRLYRLKKFLGRNRALTAICSVALAALGLSARYAYLQHEEVLQKLAFGYSLRAEQFIDKEDDPVGAAYYLESYKTYPTHLALANAFAFAATPEDRPRIAMTVREAVNHVRFSPDGLRVLASGENTTFIESWDAADGKPLDAVGFPKTEDLSLNEDRTVASFSVGKNLRRVWDIKTGRSLLLESPSGWAGMALYVSLLPPAEVKILEPKEEREIRLRLPPAGPVSGPLTPFGGGKPEEGIIRHFALNKDSSRVITSFAAGKARLWDAKTGRPYGPELSHAGEITGVAFSPDGRLAATASADGTAQVWDAATGAPVGRPLRHGERVNSIAFSPDSARALTSGADGTARLWDARTGNLAAAVMRHQGPVLAAVFSPDGRFVLSGGEDMTARVWDASSGNPTGRIVRHPNAVTAVAFSPDGRLIATGGRDEALAVWDAAAPAPKVRLSHPGEFDRGARFAGFLPDGAPFGFDYGRLTRLAGGKEGGPAEPVQLGASEMILSEDGALGATHDLKDSVTLWDMASLSKLPASISIEGGVQTIAFSPDRSLLIAAGGKGEAGIWDLKSGKRILTLPHASYRPAVAVRPDNKEALIGSWVWDLEAAKALGRPIDGVEVTKKGLIEKKSGKRLGWAPDNPGSISAASFSPDGRRLILGRLDGSVITLSMDPADPLRGAKKIKHSRGVTVVRYSPDGRTLLTASEDRTARLWDAETLEPLGRPLVHDLGGKEAYEGEVLAGAFSRDGGKLVTATPGGIYVWEVPWLVEKPSPAVLADLSASQKVFIRGGTPFRAALKKHPWHAPR